MKVVMFRVKARVKMFRVPARSIDEEDVEGEPVGFGERVDTSGNRRVTTDGDVRVRR